MIRLPAQFTEIDGAYSWDSYFANLALVEMAVKELTDVTTPPISEKLLGKELNGNGQLEEQVITIQRKDV